MATIADITRGLKAVQTVSQARVALGEAIGEVRRALDSGPRLAGDLRASLSSLEIHQGNLVGLPGNSPIPARTGLISSITRAYVNVAGAVGEVRARQTVSLARELERAAGELPERVFAPVGKVIGSAARSVGEAGGAAVGGILSGLGPIVVVILAIVVWVKFFRKA